MVGLMTAAVAGALAEVATAATVSTMAGGVIGNRTDAVFVKSFRAISAGFRHLSGTSEDETATIILKSVQTAFRRSFDIYLETLSSQSTCLADRIFLDGLQAAAASSLDAFEPNGALELADAVRPLMASVAAGGIWTDGTAPSGLTQAVVEWCERVAGPMPSHFRAILTQSAPDGQRPWIISYRDALGTELLRNHAFEKLLVISHLSDAAESAAILRASALSLQANIDVVDAKLGRVDWKVNQILVHQDDQLTQLRRLSGLLDQISSAASPETSSRALTQAMFGASGQVIPVALIFVSAFSSERMVESLSRSDRQTLVREVQARLMEAAGGSAYVGRFDGGEFDVIIRAVDGVNDVARRCQEILTAFFPPFEIGGISFSLSPKLGVALSPDHGFSPDALQRNADLALRYGYSYGATDITFYKPEFHRNAEDRRRVERDLRHALLTDGLSLAFQPIISLRDKVVVGYEALLRWIHPERGPVSPAVFIPVAEDAGLINQIGQWVIKAACGIASRWEGDTWVAVNISPSQFADPAFPEVLEKMLLQCGLFPDRLELEITESVFLNDNHNTDTMFKRLKSLGVRLALDDFGTGFSSLAYLQRAPFDRIKIDRSFVHGANHADSRNMAIIQSIVSLAKSSEMDVTAEGVESNDELELVEFLGCSHAQGFFVGRPLNADEIQVSIDA